MYIISYILINKKTRGEINGKKIKCMASTSKENLR